MYPMRRSRSRTGALIPFDEAIAAGISSGHLCPKPLDSGDPCGRKIDKAHGLDLCRWHSEDELGIAHQGEHEEKAPPKNVCTRCHKRPVAFRVSRLCGNCQKTMHRQHLVSNHRRETV